MMTFLFKVEQSNFKSTICYKSVKVDPPNKNVLLI